MRYSSIPSAQLVLQHCKAKNIKNIVISPGSRNAPLTIGFSEDPFFSCFSVVDERSAAFFALGIAQQLRKPVAVVCTSGSALLNYYPAVAEAFYSGIPLVVISADRPTYKIDVGDGQTIRQENAYHRHIGYSANLKQDVLHAVDRLKKYVPEWLEGGALPELQEKVKAYNDDELNKALNLALEVKLPVHINVPFEEPLYDTLSETTTVAAPLFPERKELPGTGDMQGFVDQWNASGRKMVLVGVNPPKAIERQYLDILATDPSVIVFTETTSNLHHDNFFPSIDSILAPIEKSGDKDALFDRLRPDILLTFGGLVVSKKIKAFLREYRPGQHWHVDPTRAFDTFFSLSHHFDMEANSFFGQFLNKVRPHESDYYAYWNTRKEKYRERRKEYYAQIPFSDLSVFHSILNGIPENYQVQLSNSSTIRYTQLFDMHPSLRVFCNRGTSGIDGSTSTAVGASVYSKEPTLLITGDVSFFYDSNGLWNNYIRPDFRIIVINNGGGGIFRILPGHEETENFETFFETAHGLSARHLGKQFGFDYSVADDPNSLKSELESFYLASGAPKILEVVTSRILNDKILLGYFDFISSAQY
ncbi:2-succinyl-5-enolpyruvyl-6-hydroxy-3-cyclohexene-1-carboxylic-acid synthase [Pseudozobellia thermophila]|uniref:2-succinyl-5-enolpyruvyl-6-hydroxy-3-cyclohexene-1-carboxylate synthase n=1 Tax=Pseudozobellia thermophila TaxID=192903 RepID=A0A1M6LDI5_9FLAO|nr:2-succinyl-5-enolpyruvyl-6-hydroxy-3-cyclohexene-1-carboxylic-acid synthase [Pseudozobellia thermophila]SHJ69269.1 2-succinyl-5-enolpyruvyl-6-hydroxy-3-cyclohexene-1-carboxylate synthase [Pseudozobellia thermophila]